MIALNVPPVVTEPARTTPVLHECDVCVIGGSCTGVFAAVRAARLGLRVALVEKMGCFGGVATLSLVNVWHSPYDETFERQIIGGLTLTVIERLRRRDAVRDSARSPHWAWSFNPQELQIELDELIREEGIRPWLHTSFVQPLMEGRRIKGILVENKSGRGAILADQFIDASGDGDVAERIGLPTYRSPETQPSTTCAVVSGWGTIKDADVGRLIREQGAEFGLPPGFVWGAPIPGSDNYMLAATRIAAAAGATVADADALTAAEMEGRRQVRAILDLVGRHIPAAKVTLQALPARLGIRETRHVRCRYQLTGNDVLHGKRFDDAIANGSYRVDIHHPNKPGITLRYLDGREEYNRPGMPGESSRWRPETPENPTFYQIPFRAMIPKECPNLLVAGRMLDADPVAHAAIRVMVNMNQVGEAAGVAAALAVRDGGDAADVDPAALREELAHGGSVVL
ncbi:MAG TPA: FAD-dependent oxidoreductase [Candidatus Methylacidiphilales bacterium]